MAEVHASEENLLMSKWGPMPVWAWALVGLLLAWIYSKYRSMQAAAAASGTTSTTTSSTSTGAAQGQAVAPQWIIEDNLPSENENTTTNVSVSGTPSAPVPVPPSGGGPVMIGHPIPGSPAPNPPPTSGPPPPPKPQPKPPLAYKVHPGDNLSSIAQRYHTTWQALWQYNTTPGVRPASTIAELKRRGPNMLYSNETIYIPQ